jgi:hypothetical protein
MPTLRTIITLGIDMCRALELCQRFSIVHRDIKPENIFVSELGDFKLGDFGIARTVEKTTGFHTKIGTSAYMAPEIYREGAYGSSVDIYSLGIVLYRMLNDNRTPFLPEHPTPIAYSDREAALAKRISGAKMPAPRHAEGRLAEIVLKACSYDSKDRYSSPMQMRQELEAIMYSREEASVIYPQGDKAPIEPVEYVEDGPYIGTQSTLPTSPLLPVEANLPVETSKPVGMFQPVEASPPEETEILIKTDKTPKKANSLSGSTVIDDAMNHAKTESLISEVSVDESISVFTDHRTNDSEYESSDDISFDEDEAPYLDGYSAYNNGEYVLMGRYEGRAIEWIVYNCDAMTCCLICKDILYTSRYNGKWAKSEIRDTLNNKLFSELFTPMLQKGFVSLDGDMLTIASVNDFYVFEENLRKKQIKCNYHSWLKEKNYCLNMYGWIDELEYLEEDLVLGVRPMCKIDISVIEVISGSGDISDPYVLAGK